jgi:MFS family permease
MNPETPVEDKDKVYEAGEIAPGANVSFDPEKGEEIDGRGQTPEVDTKLVDIPPDGGYGWVCVACCFIMNAHTWGVNSVSPFFEHPSLKSHTDAKQSYGVFLSHYLTINMFPGAGSLEFAFVGGLSISMALLVSPVATVCIREFGTQAALSIGILLETAGLLGASFASEIWHLFLSQGVAFGLGMGFIFVASVGIIPQWFSKKRSFANSIGASGSGIGGLIYSLATNAMIQHIGLGWAFRILAIISCVVNVMCTILVRDRNKAVGAVQMAFDVRLFKRGEFVLVLMWGFFSMLGYVVLLFSMPNYAKSIGLNAQQGSVVGAMLNLGQGMYDEHSVDSTN